ncbi:MAG TPA: dihydrofolate reductase family protein, partial [Vulgatibacter sp.]
MSRLRFRIAMSLDGFVAGPAQSVANPLGIGGTRLHEWAFATAAFRELHGLVGGDEGPSHEVAKRSLAGIGATIMGRNMFGGHPGAWDAREPWEGWWGRNPPFHHPVFVLTHHPREPLVLEGGTTFTFVTDGIESALAQARHAADGKDVTLAGGAHVAKQYLGSGYVDEMLLHIVPVLLGAGERLFDGMGDDLHGLRLRETVATPDVTHLYFGRPS